MLYRIIIGFILLSSITLLFYYPPPMIPLAFLLIILNGYDIWKIYENGNKDLFYEFLLIIYSIIGLYLILCNYTPINERKLLFDKILLVSLSDIAQFFFGKFFGKHPVGGPSSQKTWEGYIGAILIILLGNFFISFFNSILWVGSGIIGDLFVSVCKRKLEIKDTSNLLGPHGGWLDRVDGIYMALIISGL